MTREKIYASLMRLYPKRFRREYEDQMLHTFRELSRDSPHAPVYFWSVILHDVCRSVVREYVDAWTCGMGRLARDWVSACSLGAMASGAVMWVFIRSVNLLFPPRYDPSGFVHIVATNPTGVYGALIGLVIGSAQALVLRHQVRRGVLWIGRNLSCGRRRISAWSRVGEFGSAFASCRSAILRASRCWAS
jgi:hypothetical protein